MTTVPSGTLPADRTRAGKLTFLARRIIPCLDVAAGRVVKGVRFRDLVDQGDPAEAAARYAAQGADEIVFLDVTAAPERRGTDLAWVEAVAERVFVPLTVGGGVRSVDDARALLTAGADKVGVNTAAVERPALVEELAEVFGAQCVVLSVDVRRTPVGAAPGKQSSRAGAAARSGRTREPQHTRQYVRIPGRTRDDADDPRSRLIPGRWEVVTHGGRQPAGRDAMAWIIEAVTLGAGEVLLTSIDADGTRAGYDLDLLAEACAAVPVPVIASGGAGSIDHLAAALETGAAAVLAASIFHQGDWTVGEVKRALAERGFPMRLTEAPL